MNLAAKAVGELVDEGAVLIGHPGRSWVDQSVPLHRASLEVALHPPLEVRGRARQLRGGDEVVHLPRAGCVLGLGGGLVGVWWGPRGAENSVAALPSPKIWFERQKLGKCAKLLKIVLGGRIPWSGGEEAAGPLEYRPGRKHTHTVIYRHTHTLICAHTHMHTRRSL